MAPSDADLAIRSYGNAGGLFISNTTGAVTIADSLKLGGGSIAEHNNGSFRVLNQVHDVGMNFAVSGSAVPAAKVVVLSLDAATGATVQGALSISGSCTVGGKLVVQATNVLDALANAESAASTVVKISSVTGLEAALANKQPLLSSNASVELDRKSVV